MRAAWGVTFALLTLLLVPGHARAQTALVKRVTTETDDGVLFTAWLEHRAGPVAQDLAVHFKVENRSPRTIYLVRKDKLELINERGLITIETPRPLPHGHGPYDYNFTEIKSGAVYKDRAVIPKEHFHTEGYWYIQVGFGYVRDVTGLNRRLRPREDPAGLRALLDSRLRTLLLGVLTLTTATDDQSNNGMQPIRDKREGF